VHGECSLDHLNQDQFRVIPLREVLRVCEPLVRVRRAVDWYENSCDRLSSPSWDFHLFEPEPPGEKFERPFLILQLQDNVILSRALKPRDMNLKCAVTVSV
jgi:hypothetical protein